MVLTQPYVHPGSIVILRLTSWLPEQMPTMPEFLLNLAMLAYVVMWIKWAFTGFKCGSNDVSPEAPKASLWKHVWPPLMYLVFVCRYCLSMFNQLTRVPSAAACRWPTGQLLAKLGWSSAILII